MRELYAPTWPGAAAITASLGSPHGPTHSRPSCCRATGATALVNLGAPTADELGFAKSLEVEEVGGQMVVRLQQAETKGKVNPTTPDPKPYTLDPTPLPAWVVLCSHGQQPRSPSSQAGSVDRVY